MGSSDSESEDERRVVRSAKDKATQELLSICNEIRVSCLLFSASEVAKAAAGRCFVCLLPV